MHIIISTFIATYGLIPIAFTLISGLLVMRKHKQLLAIPIGLLSYQVLCIVVLLSDPIAGFSTLLLLAVISPSILSIGSIIWCCVKMKATKEKQLGILISLFGYGLSSVNVFWVITAIWATI